MLRKRPHMLVYMCWKRVPRVIRSRAYSTAHPYRSGGGLLGVQTEAVAPTQAPRSACSPGACALSKTQVWSEEQLWSCLQLVMLIHPVWYTCDLLIHPVWYTQCDTHVLAHYLFVLVERQTSRHFLSTRLSAAFLWRVLPAPSPGQRPPLFHKGPCLCRPHCCAGLILYPALQHKKHFCSRGSLSPEPFAYSSG